MDGRTSKSAPSERESAPAQRRLRRAAGIFVLAAFYACSVHAQLLDSTLDDLVQDQIQQQVADDLADTLASDVAQQVASQVVNSVEQQVESSVVETIQRQVESSVVETIEQQVESGVVETIEQQVESGVVETIEQQVESGVVETIEQQVESGVVETIEQQVESGVTEAIGRQLETTVEGGLEAVDRIREDGIGVVVEGEVGVGGAAEGRAPAANERFFAEVDAAGRAAERDVWVVLVPAQYAARIEGWGFTVRERRELPSLQRVLLRVAAPEDRDIAQAALDLALDAPGTLVDFNHVYRESADDGAPLPAAAAAGLPAARTVSPAAEVNGAPYRGLAIGIVDTAVAPRHEALSMADVVQQDFVPFTGARPSAHGTAVASILVGDSHSVHGQLRPARLYAASVFFADGDGDPAATTASLVAALEWLVARGVHVINMSLAGPPNRVLEAAIGTLAERGTLVVAAVGNNGPNGEPLYPAAYPPVVGVTAVDSANRVYRYANRGRQVMFAAPGVRIKVARSDGGYGFETGTSMAAPYAAAIIARNMHERGDGAIVAVLAALKAAAIDLGPKDFDEVYGFGLIAGAQPAPALRTSR